MDLMKLKERVERRFEIEYRATIADVRVKVGDPREAEKVARKIARKRVDSWLSQYGLTLGILYEKIYAPNVSLKSYLLGRW